MPPHNFQEDLFLDLLKHWGETDQQFLVWSSLLVLKMGVIFPFLKSLWIFPACCDFSNMMESGLTTSASSPQGTRMQFMSHGVMDVWVSKLIFCYDGRNFIHQDAVLRFRDMTDVERVLGSENWKEKIEHLSMSSPCWLSLVLSHLRGRKVYFLWSSCSNPCICIVILHCHFQIQL